MQKKTYETSQSCPAESDCCAYHIEDKGEIRDLERDNTDFTFYVEILIDLRQDQKVNSNQKLIARSPYIRIKTHASYANSPKLNRESGPESPL